MGFKFQIAGFKLENFKFQSLKFETHPLREAFTSIRQF